MLKGSPSDLDYAKLLKEARRIEAAPESLRLRIALLGDCAVQQLSPLLKALFARVSVQVEIYEGGFDASDAEVYHPGSGLYAFKPDLIAFLDSIQPLRDAFFATVERDSFAAAQLERITGRWRAVEERCGAAILQANFVVPFERPFGNFERKLPHSLQETVARLNGLLAGEARKHKSVFINDVEFLASYLGRKNWFDEKLWCLAKSYCALEHLPLVAQNIVDIALALRGAGVKCLILDLDNTLWGGVIGDDGLEGIRLAHLGDGEAFVALQRFALELSRRGILLAVCSKNDFENAILPFREHPDMVLREKDITLFVANWNDKAQNLISIKEALNLGYDSMVFLDDNPFERNLVRKLLPEVIVPELPEDPAEVVKALSELNLFETAAHSALDANRTELYKKAAQQEELKRNFATLDDYLRSLEMEIEVRRFNEFDLPRIAQLIQRSNQFNLATRRYSEAQCAALIDAPDVYPLSVRLKDRYSDHGLISVVILKFEETSAVIDEYLMSCRVLQRGVESFVMSHLVEAAKQRGLSRIEGLYIPTKKNAMVKEFYKQFGFRESGSEPTGAVRWSLEVEAFVPRPTFLRERAPSADLSNT